ncbi:hypothetical protein BSLA_02f1746 [Burkholderia stabilis]|nr:hypothetical protein BSLA_02f1746 [Burkholderia stabilis]
MAHRWRGATTDARHASADWRGLLRKARNVPRLRHACESAVRDVATRHVTRAPLSVCP